MSKRKVSRKYKGWLDAESIGYLKEEGYEVKLHPTKGYRVNKNTWKAK